jgi:hypothetical protein
MALIAEAGLVPAPQSSWTQTRYGRPSSATAPPGKRGPTRPAEKGRGLPSAAAPMPVEPGAWELARPARRRLIGVNPGCAGGDRRLAPVQSRCSIRWPSILRGRGWATGTCPARRIRARAVLVEGVEIPAGGSGPMRSVQPGPAWGAPDRATGGTGRKPGPGISGKSGDREQRNHERSARACR